MQPMGPPICQYGEKHVEGATDNGTPFGMRMQVADVKQVLCSVKIICDSGNEVISSGDNSYIWNPVNGRATALRQKDGVFSFDLWIPKPAQVQNVKQANEKDDNAVNQGFHWQGVELW